MRYTNIVLLALFLTCSEIGIAGTLDLQYTREQLHAELEWIARTCKKPRVPPPKSIPTLSYEDFLKVSADQHYKPHFAYWRRWIDINGDGICEVFDVNMPKEAALSGRFYGYTTTVRRIEGGKWTGGFEGGWFPLVLKDKKYAATYHLVSPFSGKKDGYYSSTGLTPGSNWGKIYEGSNADICNAFRRNISLAYMLAFDPPQELTTDDLMSEEWTGGLEIFAVFNGLSAVKQMAGTLSCIKPYLDVAADIEIRIRERYATYFSGAAGIK